MRASGSRKDAQARQRGVGARHISNPVGDLSGSALGGRVSAHRRHPPSLPLLTWQSVGRLPTVVIDGPSVADSSLAERDSSDARAMTRSIAVIVSPSLGAISAAPRRSSPNYRPAMGSAELPQNRHGVAVHSTRTMIFPSWMGRYASGVSDRATGRCGAKKQAGCGP